MRLAISKPVCGFVVCGHRNNPGSFNLAHTRRASSTPSVQHIRRGDFKTKHRRSQKQKKTTTTTTTTCHKNNATPQKCHRGPKIAEAPSLPKSTLYPPSRGTPLESPQHKEGFRRRGEARRAAGKTKPTRDKTHSAEAARRGRIFDSYSPAKSGHLLETRNAPRDRLPTELPHCQPPGVRALPSSPSYDPSCAGAFCCFRSSGYSPRSGPVTRNADSTNADELLRVTPVLQSARAPLATTR